MTKKFNSIFENMMDAMSQPALTPIGPMTVEVIDGEDAPEEISEDLTEYEIAEKIITKAKKLRKKIGEESYHYIRSIIDLAERLKDIHPNVEMVEGESNTVEEAYTSNKLDFLSAVERTKINNALANNKVLTGLVKIRKPGIAISNIAGILSDNGYTLDMVSGDLLMGDKGNRMLPFRRKWTNDEDPFNENPRIENSYISFTWENLSRENEEPRFEIIAYAS